MKVLKITKNDVKETENYWKDYVGKEDVSQYDGHIEIEGGLGYVRFTGRLCATGHIIAEAGSGIKAGSGIEAGSGIKAGEGIEAGLFISCKLMLNVAYRIFAGVAVWKENPTDEEKTITCGKLENGKVEYGILNVIGLPDENINEEEKEDIIELNGKKYKLIEG